MKLPNGYGTVYKLSGKRRNPYMVRKTTGWTIDENGAPIQNRVTIGYYPTRQAALAALAEYNKNPYDIESSTITFEEVYRKWSNEHFKEISPSGVRTWTSAYNHCSALHKMKFRDIRVVHLEGALDNPDNPESIRERMKSLFNLMFKYALRYDLTDKDYAKLCKSVKRAAPQIERIPFTDNEIELLRANCERVRFADMLLVGIYSGWRPQELAILKLSDIDLENRTMKGGLKTDAGKNRLVPIHPKIYDLIEKNYNRAVELGSESLFNDELSQTGLALTYDKYRKRFIKVCDTLGIKHTPHDTRHTFITRAKSANVNEYLIKLLVGHAIEDITEKTYTHRTIDELRQAIELIN